MTSEEIERMMKELTEQGMNAYRPIGPCPETEHIPNECQSAKIDYEKLDREAEEIMRSVGLE